MERDQLKRLALEAGATEGPDGLVRLGPAGAAGTGNPSGGTAPAPDGLGWLGIATGGSSGAPRWARHDERTVGAAAAGFRAHFGLERVNAIDVLPAYHVSGFMARVRCAATGGRHVAWDWKVLERGGRPALDAAAGGWVISLVPTQLQRLLARPESAAWLRGFDVVLVGGGPVWGELAARAAAEGVRAALTYGMTETAAMVTAQRPAEFAAGDRSSGHALPHASLRVDEAGRIWVGGASLFRGYAPAWRDGPEWATTDLGELDAAGRLLVSGRADAVIITGGKKVQPAAVEAVLRASGEFADIAVIGVPDSEWGEAVVACYPEGGTGCPDLAKAAAGLAAHERPKRAVAISPWPRTEHGKVNRAALRARVMERGGA